MYCHKCGHLIHANAAACSHCGIAVDHHANIEAFGPQKVFLVPRKTFQTYSRKLKNSLIINFFVWLLLAVPAVALTLGLHSFPGRFQHLNFGMAYASLTIILMLIFYFVKRGLQHPLKH